MAEQGDAVAFFRDAPPRVVIEIVRCLPSISILRLRAVCKGLRDVMTYRPLLAAVQLLQPPQPLICFGADACPSRYIQLRDYCVEALDLRSDVLRSILRFSDNEYYDNFFNIEGLDAPNIIVMSKDRISYGDEEDDGEGKAQLTVHASVDGLLLVSFVNIWYVCNPATRQWAALPDLSDFHVIGLYEHVSSGGYRVLYTTGRDDENASTCYYVLTVGAQEARSIGCPISPASYVDVGLAIGLVPSSLAPPLQLGCNLYWPPQERQSYHILVFDTEAEVFSWMRAPHSIRHSSMQLLEMNRKLAMSVSQNSKPTLELWCLVDYSTGAWFQVYQITVQVPRIPALRHVDWFPHVVSPEGDVLIECSNKLILHCDRRGNLLQKFQFREEAPLVRHVLKESLLPHAFFLAPKPADVVELPFFQGL